METQQIQKITDAEYFDVKAISASQIKQYDRGAYWFWKTSPYNDEKGPEQETDALVFGKLCHCLLLEPDHLHNEYAVVDFGASRKNKKYETAKELTPAEIIYYACVENDINVVWVLANIQKEQSLIGQNYSNHQTRLNRATGYMNDTSSGRRHFVEGEKYCGFIGQVIGCSYQFKKNAGDGKGMEEAYYTYTPASESGNMPYDTFMSTIYTPYSDWFDRAMGR